MRALENYSATLQIDYIDYIIEQFGFLLVSLVGCITFILLSFLLENWNRSKWLRIIGFHSLYIYIMHVIVVGMIKSVLINFFHLHDYLLILLPATILGVLIPIIFYNLIGKKYLWFLFTTYRNKKEITGFKGTNVKPPEILLPRIPSGVNNI